ncbi:hypothetical protein HYDPIDRAFT_29886 [Hydnomerulius pinastri MD-312]|uniref:F-box domain-containing protein n=1 Tax=Hydnomerulius pinastri MD-312 TaxID=994086 RepID=A0A0C9W7L2_9AGAM|nr:hypothetical protein HYDPIDRAFT_29886 [Hydnomerulius pinastri MD-312]
MHPALNVVEIQRNIFNFLDPRLTSCHQDDLQDDLDPEVSYRHLSVLARTCRSFSDQALDNLWHTQESLGPLLLCLSEEIVDRSDDEDGFKIYITLKAVPTVEDWARTRKYATRIRRIDRNISLSTRYIVDHESLLKLQTVSHVSGLMLSPQYLDHNALFGFENMWDVAEWLLCMQIFHRSLFTFKMARCHRLHAGGESRVIETFFNALVSQSPDLQCVNIQVPEQSSGKVLSCLSRLSKLRRLQLQGLSSEPLPLTLSENSFGSLHRLSLAGRTTQMIDVIGAIQSKKLEYFSCFFKEDDPEPVLLAVQSKPAWRVSLKDILIGRWALSRGTPVQVLSVRILLSFPNLRRIHGYFLGITLDDVVLKDLARGLPHLEVLSFTAVQSISSSDSHVTLRGLVPFAVHCPQLSVLGFGVPIDGTSIPELPTDSTLGLVGSHGEQSKQQLVFATFGRSTLLDAGAVASFLLALFQRWSLKIKVYPEGGECQWAAVSDLVAQRHASESLSDS